MTQTQAIGALQPFGRIEVYAPPGGSAVSDWFAVAGPTGASAAWFHHMVGDASAGSHDLVVEFVATAPAPIQLELSQHFEGTVGATVPNVMIDIGNDGTFDVGYTSSFTLAFTQYTLGTLPFEVRVRYGGAAAAGASLLTTTTVRAAPRNDLWLTSVAEGCFGSSTVLPVFADRGIAALASAPPVNAPSVLALGLASQPLVLPTPFAGAPCLLLPRPDLTLPFWGTTSIEIPLPAAVRPTQLWLQRVLLANSQLVTDDAFWVQAY